MQHARDWERYAYVKARLVTGYHFEDELYRNVLTPFVYRRYLDYGMFDALRQMKSLIDREVARKDMIRNIKLGRGGIREIEFVAQVFQLIRGGHDRRLRERHLLDLLPRLGELELLSADSVTELTHAYRHLRVLENRLQELDDKQTHDLPVDNEQQARLAMAMGADRWDEVDARTNQMRETVAQQFAAIAWPEPIDPVVGEASQPADAWEAGDVAGLVTGCGLDRDEAVIDQLYGLRESGLYHRQALICRSRFLSIRKL